MTRLCQDAAGGTIGTAYYDVDREESSRRFAEKVAHLFAAAPDLLAACLDVIEATEGAAATGSAIYPSQIERIRDLLTAAVNKARGEAAHEA